MRSSMAIPSAFWPKHGECPSARSTRAAQFIQLANQMGSKAEAKALMAEAGVPVLDRLDPDGITDADLPVLIKASSGGGGRGMRVVGDLASLADEVELASAEFLADESGRFYFLEMNTRLQVEHPVTEVTTGTDLVALHLNVADGGTLDEHPPSTAGHAIEVRLYAEEPAENYQPQSGTLHRFAVPGVATEFKLPPGFDVGGSSGIRLDSGVEDASVVGTHYDPMLAKLIAWAPTRTETTRRMAAALRSAAIHGVRTDRALLVRILDHPAFQAGDTDTAFLDRHELPALSVPLADEEATSLSALAGALALAADNQRAATVLAGLPSGWRNVVSQPQHKSFHLLDRTVAGTAEPDRHDRRIDVFCRVTRDGLQADAFDAVELVSMAPDRVVLRTAGVQRRFEVAIYGDAATDGRLVYVDSPLGPVALETASRFPSADDQSAPGSLLAPMPGSIVRIAVAADDEVVAGQPLMWLEAMKMQHQIYAPVTGTITEVDVTEQRQVEVGVVLAVVAEENS